MTAIEWVRTDRRRRQFEPEMPADFHETVAQRRDDLGLTQARIERDAALRAGFMSYLETGRMKRLPLPTVYRRLCRVLEFTPAESLELAGYLTWSKTDEAYLREVLECLVGRAAA